MSLESEIMAKLVEHEQNELRWVNARDIWVQQDKRKDAEIERLRSLVVSITSGGAVALYGFSDTPGSREHWALEPLPNTQPRDAQLCKASDDKKES